jgi:hypothetical protein
MQCGRACMLLIKHSIWTPQITLKDQLWEMLKEVKTRTSNEEDLEKATFQCDKVLTQLMTTNGHISKNVLKLGSNPS